MKKNILLVGLVVFALAACKPQTTAPVTGPEIENPTTPVTTETDQTETAVIDGETIVDLAAANPNFSVLIQALETTGLDQTLAGPGPYTLFAPTDTAFANLPEGEVQSLLQDTQRLSQILRYHVVSGDITAEQIKTMSSVTTLQGEVLEIDIQGERIGVGQGALVQTDIAGSNGKIHAIDTVLMPSN